MAVGPEPSYPNTADVRMHSLCMFQVHLKTVAYQKILHNLEIAFETMQFGVCCPLKTTESICQCFFIYILYKVAEPDSGTYVQTTWQNNGLLSYLEEPQVISYSEEPGLYKLLRETGSCKLLSSRSTAPGSGADQL